MMAALIHESAMSERQEPDSRDPNPNCGAEVEHASGGFWDDVSWEVFYCPECDVFLCCVGGGRHWWNYVLSEESQKRLFPHGLRERS